MPDGLIVSTKRLIIFILALYFVNISVCVAVGADQLNHAGATRQYSGGFNPGVGYGGFGGGTCTAAKTPVIFLHGNGDTAVNWDYPPAGRYTPASGKSVYDYFISQGYNPCELFGVTYLSNAEKSRPQGNYYQPSKYDIINNFINAVKAYTGKSQVDIVAHSMGVGEAIGALTYYDSWGSVRSFINIAGAIKGLNSCLSAGCGNALAATCGSQNIYNSYTFGHYPNLPPYCSNSWTAAKGTKSMRLLPGYRTAVNFYTIHAGQQDQVHCSTNRGWNDCGKGALFNNFSNVKAQLNVGAGSTPKQINYDFSNWSITNSSGGDADGIGHFRAKNNMGEIIWQMLNSGCTGISCKNTYAGPVMAE